MEKRKLPRCKDAKTPTEKTKKPVARTREGGRLGVPEAQEATRHLGWYLVQGCLGGDGARSLRDKPALGVTRRGEALPLQRERH